MQLSALSLAVTRPRPQSGESPPPPPPDPHPGDNLLIEAGNGLLLLSASGADALLIQA